MFLDLLYTNIFFIHLDDCSDFSCSYKTIYNKFGFTQTSNKDEEMYIFFENNTNEEKNINIEPYLNIKPYENIKDLLEKNIHNMNLDKNYLINFNELFTIEKKINKRKERNITKEIINKINYNILNMQFGGVKKSKKTYLITDINIYKNEKFLNIYHKNNNKLYIKKNNKFELL